MNRLSSRTLLGVLLATLASTGCGASSGRPTTGAPSPTGAAAGHPAGHGSGGERQRVGYTLADVRFMQGMLAHHAQALVMTALVPTRTSREEVRRLAERIAVSQDDEIQAIRQWLRKRGEEIPEVDAHAHHAMMPGMLGEAELSRLAAARGPAFDRLFLEYMIRHHEGALVMVKELFAAENAGQEPDLFRFASDVDADQRMEIERMRGLLSGLTTGANPR